MTDAVHAVHTVHTFFAVFTKPILRNIFFLVDLGKNVTGIKNKKFPRMRGKIGVNTVNTVNTQGKSRVFGVIRCERCRERV